MTAPTKSLTLSTGLYKYPVAKVSNEYGVTKLTIDNQDTTQTVTMTDEKAGRLGDLLNYMAGQGVNLEDSSRIWAVIDEAHQALRKVDASDTTERQTDATLDAVSRAICAIEALAREAFHDLPEFAAFKKDMSR